MATITSTIKLVDQMTPTLNKINDAIDRVIKNANKLNGAFDEVESDMQQTGAAITVVVGKVSKLTRLYEGLKRTAEGLASANIFNRFSNGVNKATNYTRKLYYALRNVSFIITSIKGLSWIADYVDTMMNATSRLNNINDGLYTTSQYIDMIYASAQRSRGNFTDMITQISKLGTVAGQAFGGSVPQMIAFAELLNKTFRIAGSSAAEASNATYQLTQAMAAGKLQGDEMRSILENAPLLAQKIADELGVTIGEIKQLGAEGKVTADVIKKALFNAADEIEQKFGNLPRTLGDVWTNISNAAQNAFRRVVQRVQDIINTPAFQAFENTIIGIINRIADAVIWLFDQFNRPTVQAALRKITLGLQAMWKVVLEVGTVVYNVVSWMCDNWSWLGQIVYSVIAIVLLYKAVMLAVSAAVVVAEIAMGIAGWVSALMTGQAWAWVILIIVAFIALIYAGVAVWNYFTGAAVSATGVLFGVIAFVITAIKDLLLLLWDVAATSIQILIAAGRTILMFGWNVVLTLVKFIGNLIQLVITAFLAVCVIVGRAGQAIKDTFTWLLEVFKVWGSNIMIGMSQLCQNLPLYWEYFKLSVVQKFWSMVYSAGQAFNSLLNGARDLCAKMIQPFVDFAQGVINLLNSIIDGWNALCDKLTMTIDTNVVTTAMGIAGKEIGLSGGKVNRLGGVTNPLIGGGGGGINLSGAAKNLASAGQSLNSVKGSIGDVNWSTNAIPEYKADWGGIFDGIGDMFDSSNYMDHFDHWDVEDFTTPWKDMWSKAEDIWDFDQYSNPVDAFNKWYQIGTGLENGMDGIADFIGALLNGFGNGIPSSSETGSPIQLPGSLEELLNTGTGGGGLPIGSGTGSGGGGSGSGGKGGSGASDALDNIAKNTGGSAGSLANIEDTLDLAEEELELLRKLAEQEVINRFTTAEIHVDMTNNNNINSSMDLDGIVTHLSSKLYEELGVVASGVHY